MCNVHEPMCTLNHSSVHVYYGEICNTNVLLEVAAAEDGKRIKRRLYLTYGIDDQL